MFPSSLLAATEIVERVASLLSQPVDIVEMVLWSTLATGFGLASLHLVTMLVTRWGDRSIEWKSLIFSLLFHVSCLFGLVAVNPPERLSFARADERDSHQQQIEISAKLAEVDEQLAAPKSGNTRVWEKLPDAPDQELIRTNRSQTERQRVEGPQRRPDPLMPPDVQVTDKTALPDEPTVRPELKQSAEPAPTRVEAAAPLKIDDPTAEARPDVSVPSLAPLQRRNQSGAQADATARQPNVGSVDRVAPQFESSKPFLLPETIATAPTAAASPSQTRIKESGPRRSGPAPASIAADETGAVADHPAGGNSGGSVASSPFSRLRVKTARGQDSDGPEKFHFERKAQAPDAIPGNAVDVRDGIRTEIPNDGLMPRPVQPNFESSRLGKRTTVPLIYEGRNLARRREVARKFGGTDASERAVELSLRWLAAHQDPEGFWDADGYDVHCPDGNRCSGHAGQVKIDEEGRQYVGKDADTGLTALSLLAFLGAGYTHEEGQYADQIDRTLSWMIRQQRADGYLGGQATHFEQMYCHAMATYSLAEAIGMQSDLSSTTRLREPLARAVAYIIDNQNPDGGWRYVNGQSSDMSIFGWQLMALKSSEIAGLSIPENAKSKMVQFLKVRSLGQNKGLAGYRLVGGQLLPPTDSMTAEALFCKQMLGISRTNPASTEAVQHMLQRLPRASGHNLYYWYYGTLAMYQYGGSPWRQWNEALRDTLIAEQRTKGHVAGSWDPRAPWGAYGGRIFSTAVSSLCLEVYYRFLPLYQMGGQYEEVQDR